MQEGNTVQMIEGQDIKEMDGYINRWNRWPGFGCLIETILYFQIDPMPASSNEVWHYRGSIDPYFIFTHPLRRRERSEPTKQS